MENHREKPNPNPNSGRKPQEDDFEFGSLAPSSLSQDPYINNSPADHLFSNGRLLPHVFQPCTFRTISRTTSEDSSRSNSTNSRSSSSSPNTYTPRASIFSNIVTTDDYKSPERKLYSRGKIVNNKSRDWYFSQCRRKNAAAMATVQLYRSNSQQWQYITAVPGAAFKREGSVKRGVMVGGGVRRVAVVRGKKKKAEEKRGCRVARWWRRLIKAVILACRECHAMEPEKLDDDVDVKRNCNCS